MFHMHQSQHKARIFIGLSKRATESSAPCMTTRGTYHERKTLEYLRTLHQGPVYMIPDHLRIGSLFISDWGCVYKALHESDPLCSNNPIQRLSASAGGTKMDPVQSVTFCFTCKHGNPTWQAPRPRFDSRMASMQMRLIDCLAEDSKYGRRNEIISAQNSVTGLFSRLRVNTDTLEGFLYRIHQIDPAWKWNPIPCKSGPSPLCTWVTTSTNKYSGNKGDHGRNYMIPDTWRPSIRWNHNHSKYDIVWRIKQ